MAAKHAGRSGRRFTRLKAEQRAKQLPCHRCGQPIDYSLQWPDPNSYSYEHKIPLSLAPHLAEDPSNGASSHLRCNQSAGNRDTKPGLGTTSRQW